ncbi:VOC family protein [Sphingomonas sp. MMS24-J13]|uniref:VOC family protein n=1 Tax=Sphingomonas sp. MMS24-J13 TaxID=3238686 RepID=UPI00384DFC0E
MTKMFKAGLIATALLAPGAAFAQGTFIPTPTTGDVRPNPPHFTQTSANVFRRMLVETRPKMIEFYAKVLAVQSLNPINFDNGAQMILFKIGSGQIKLATGQQGNRKYHPGQLNEVTGIRTFMLTYPDEAALTARFTAAGYPAPAFKDIGGGRRGALVQDPGGFWIGLIVDPKASPDTGVEVGINVSDLARSRKFYREFVGLEELPPVRDTLLGVTKYPYRRGQTTISLWSVGKNLPQDTGSAGIQYVIDNVVEVDARGKAWKIPVESPLSDLKGFALRTVWLNDPDGVTNYFAQVGVRPGAAAAPAVATPAAPPAN